MTYKLSKKSLDTLKGVKAPLVEAVKRAIEISEVDFMVGEGLRTVERQEELVKAGKSQTMASKHITGDAVDLWAYVDGKVNWDWKCYELINKAMSQAAEELNLDLVWGGSWKSFKDGVHFQIGK